MNEIVSKYLLAGDKLMAEMHLRHNLELYTVLVDHLLKNKERIQQFKETGDSQHISKLSR